MPIKFVRAQLTRIGIETKSKYKNSTFRYYFFKTADGNTYKSCIASNCRNRKHWDKIQEGMTIDHLILKRHRDGTIIINADSNPVIVNESPDGQQEMNFV